MKTCYHLICAVLFSLPVITGCSSEQTNMPEPAQIPISLKCGITTLSTRATDTGFENGDRIGLYVVNYNGDNAGILSANGNHVDNMQFTYDGTWTPATPIYWKDETTPADFYGYYPYTNTPTDVEAVPIEIISDQSNEANYKACDFFWGKTLKVTPTEQAVGLTLNHLLSCAVVKVTAGNGFTTETLEQADIQVKLNKAICKGTINLKNGNITTDSQEGQSISFLRGEHNEFKALIIPQIVPSSENFLTITIDGRDFNMSKEFTFVSGRRHTFTITVKKTNTGINVDIGSWVDDEEDNGGVAE